MTFGDGLFGSGTFGLPLDEPTAGGASSPYWGDYVRLYVRAALEAGVAFHQGTHAQDQLDAGNVMAGGVDDETPETPGIDRLWADLTCDVMDVEIAGGASRGEGIFSKADAGTCVVTLADPEGKYDPLNPVPPWSYQGHTRLLPGVPVEVFAEVNDPTDGSWTRHYLFTGTADSWGEDWTPNPRGRQAKLVATDVTKQFVRYNRPEVAPVGAGDTTAARVARIVDYFDWAGTVESAPTSTVTLQATTLAQDAWELLNRTLDDELGAVYFTNTGTLRWVDRSAWFTLTPPVCTLGCPSLAGGGEVFYDVLTDASPSNLDMQIRNRVDAARTGGVTQTATSTSSISRYGEYDYSRTDLGLANDAQVAEWATTVLELYATPQVFLADVTFQPAIHTRSWESWTSTLAIVAVTDLIRVVWAPPDRPTHVVDSLNRVVGYQHRITRQQWEVTWQLVDAQALRFAGTFFTMGDHANDALDAGFVLAFT